MTNDKRKGNVNEFQPRYSLINLDSLEFKANGALRKYFDLLSMPVSKYQIFDSEEHYEANKGTWGKEKSRNQRQRKKTEDYSNWKRSSQTNFTKPMTDDLKWSL